MSRTRRRSRSRSGGSGLGSSLPRLMPKVTAQRRPATTSVARSPREGVLPVAPRVAIASVLGLALFGILLLRLWALTVLGGAEYAARADSNVLRRLPVEAPRGSILDRKGHVIVTNVPSREVTIDLQDVPESRLQPMLVSLAKVLQVPVAKLREKVAKAPPGGVEKVVLAKDVKRDATIWYLAEHANEFPGVSTPTVYKRTYTAGSLAAHILGQVGEVSEDELKSSYANLQPGDRVGKSGIERTYDEYLRGVDGYDAVVVDAAGIRKGEGRGLPATPGRNLRLTLDLPLQRATEGSLRRNIAKASAGGDGAGAFAGAAVAIKPSTGELLAMASAPTFDPSIFVDPDKSKQVEWLYNEHNKRKPSLNRAIAGAYPPGSIYKPIVAIAAMEQGFLTPDMVINCPSSFPVGQTIFKNHDHQALGGITLDTALETSCDTYFYKLGLHFYNQPGSPLYTWSRKFGLGAPTGIDIAGEGTGVVPTPKWKRELNKELGGKPSEGIWTPGNSVNLSIGQGDLTVTPLQMTDAYATIANGGVRHTPHLGKSVDDPAGRIERGLQNDDPVDLHLKPGELQGVIDGLVKVNKGSGGTATAVFGSFEIATAGKSGTAEKFGQGDLAWYCGFAPVEDPQIAACAFIDGGGHGGAAAGPIVLEMFQQYFGADGGSTEVKGSSD